MDDNQENSGSDKSVDDILDPNEERKQGMKRKYNETHFGDSRKQNKSAKSEHGENSRLADLDSRPVGSSEVKPHSAKQFEGILRAKKDLYNILSHEGNMTLYTIIVP